MLVPYSFVRSRVFESVRSNDLAREYLQTLPHASDRVYKIFLSFMAINKFLDVIKANYPETAIDIDLLNYYLVPALVGAAKTEGQIFLVDQYRREYT